MESGSADLWSKRNELDFPLGLLEWSIHGLEQSWAMGYSDVSGECLGVKGPEVGCLNACIVVMIGSCGDVGRRY